MSDLEAVSGEALVCVAEIAAAHGLQGALRLRCFTEDPLSVAAYGPVHDADGRSLFRLRVVAPTRGGVIATAQGVERREAAEALRGTRLYVPRRRLPEPAEEEFYHADLVGLEAVDPAGTVCGRVVAIYNFGAGDVVEIAAEDGRTTMAPFTREVVPAIDLAGRRITVDLPALS